MPFTYIFVSLFRELLMKYYQKTEHIFLYYVALKFPRTMFCFLIKLTIHVHKIITCQNTLISIMFHMRLLIIFISITILIYNKPYTLELNKTFYRDKTGYNLKELNDNTSD